MALSQRLEIRHSQALVMTPQLMQAIKLLQLSNLDLAAYVEGELESNPLLEREADDAGAATDAGSAADAGDWNRTEQAKPDSTIGSELETSRTALEQQFDTDLDNVFPDDASGLDASTAEPAGYSEWAGVGAGGTTTEYNLEAFVPVRITLAEYLSEQLALATADPVQRMIGHYLIDLVDEAGYLVGELSDVADKLGALPNEVEAVLTLLQGFEPSGVCARNLAECLTIQLKERNRFDPAMEALVSRLDLLARRELTALRRICDVGDEDLNEMIAEIRELNPKPGLAFGSTEIQPVVPDVFVRPAPEGGFAVELNSDTLPRVLINNSYHAVLSKNHKDEKTKAFVTERLQSATWLLRALDQRAKTILKVSTEIVKQQDAFFTHGVRYLRPLNLKTVADAIGMHESTVSRVTANKYMATSRGIFELKYFFTSAIASADGGQAHSAEAVRHRIKKLIDSEPATAILSDDTIVERLREAGIDIARRTVAKYREALRIPSSVQRRREKQSETARTG